MATGNALVEDCMAACHQCRDACLSMATTIDLSADHSGRNADPFRILINCAEICQTTSNFLKSGSPFSSIICQACAQICFACADSCVTVGGMADCVHACRQCGQQCQRLGYSHP
jgi:hypothetical protein